MWIVTVRLSAIAPWIFFLFLFLTSAVVNFVLFIFSPLWARKQVDIRDHVCLTLPFKRSVGVVYFEMILQQGLSVTKISFSNTDLSLDFIINTVGQTQSKDEYQDTRWPSRVDFSCFCTIYKDNKETLTWKYLNMR